MGTWTLEHEGEVKTFEAWGLCRPVIRLVSFDFSTASFDHDGAEYDGAALFEFQDEIIIRCDAVVVFRGEIMSRPRSVAGMREGMGYVAADCLWAMAETSYQQTWTGGGLQGRVVMFSTLEGASLSAAEMLEDIVTYAAEECGIAVQFGSAVDVTIGPMSYDVRELTILQALQLVANWSPDVTTRMDYTTEPPTIHFVKWVNAPVKTLAVEDAVNKLDIKPLHAMQTTAVVIRYVTRDVVDGVVVPSVSADVYPPGATGKERRAVVLNVDLAGTTKQSQELETINISAEAVWWWKRHVGWLHEVTDLVITDGEIKEPDPTGASEDAPATHGWVNEIVSGAVPGWLVEEVGAPLSGTVRVSAKASYTFEGKPQTNVPLMMNVQATSLAGGVYWHEDRSGVESVPAGVAQAYYEATSRLLWDGMYSREEEEITLPTVVPGDVLNLSGPNAAALGWDTMDAQVQATELDVQTGTSSFTFGPARHLGLSDIVSRFKARSGLRESTTAQERAGNANAAAAKGPRRTASAVPVARPVTTETMPLTVYTNGDGSISITPGLVGGEPIRANSVSGAVITTIDPPTWTITTGVLYLGVKADLTFDRGTLTTWSIAAAFVASAASLPAENPTAGNFVLPLAYVVDGTLGANYSPRRNVAFVVRDVGVGDSRAAALIW